MVTPGEEHTFLPKGRWDMAGIVRRLEVLANMNGLVQVIHEHDDGPCPEDCHVTRIVPAAPRGRTSPW